MGKRQVWTRLRVDGGDMVACAAEGGRQRNAERVCPQRDPAKRGQPPSGLGLSP